MDTDQLILKEFVTHHRIDAARIIEQLKTEHSLALFEKIPVELAVKLFEEMEQYAVIKIIEEMVVEHSIKIIEKLPLQLNASILRGMKNEVREMILAKIPPQISLPLNQMLRYSVNSIGALMNPQVPAFQEDIIIKDALDRIRKSKQQLFQYIYIINRDNIFSGIVKLEDLIVAGSKEQLVSIMKTEVPHLLADTDFHKVLNHPGWIEFTELPVLDRSGIFLGALSFGKIRKMEDGNKIMKPKQAVLAANALGELYRIGLSGLLYSTAKSGIEESNRNK